MKEIGNYKKSNQIVGNVGLYYVCYELSKRGWNVLPTSRNAKDYRDEDNRDGGKLY